MRFSFSPWKRETHKQFDPHPFPGQSREVVYVLLVFFSPEFGPHTPIHLLLPFYIALSNFEVSSPCSRNSGSQGWRATARGMSQMGSRFLSSAGVGKSCVLPMRVPNPSPTLDKILASMGPGFYPVLGLGSGGRALRHFQTPTLCWIHFSPWAELVQAQWKKTVSQEEADYWCELQESRRERR